jgi:uncharacterized protein (TIGR00255 family)
MIRSMTGFARREHSAAFGTLIWELRSVNHRFLEISLRLPEELRSLEGEFRQAISQAVRRGKCDATLTLRASPGVSTGLELDLTLLEELAQRAAEVTARARPRLGELARITPIELLRWPGVLREPERDLAPIASAAQTTLDQALAALLNVRASEGRRIAQALDSRCQQIKDLVASISARLPEVRARMRAKLTERVQSLALEANRDRLEQELAILVTRMDVDEELDRLLSHVTETRAAIASDEPSGRRLDFLMQEFNREANTLSAKAQDIETTRAALDLKVLIEQMREQVQNIE